MADVRLLSYLAKVFPDELCQGKTIDSADCLRGSRVSVQLAVKPDLDGVIALDVRGCEHEIFRVDAVPVTRAAPDDRDDWYLRGAAPFGEHLPAERRPRAYVGRRFEVVHDETHGLRLGGRRGTAGKDRRHGKHSNKCHGLPLFCT